MRIIESINTMTQAAVQARDNILGPFFPSYHLEMLRALLLSSNSTPEDTAAIDHLRLMLLEKEDSNPELKLLCPLLDLQESAGHSPSAANLLRGLDILKHSEDPSALNEQFALGIDMPLQRFKELSEAAGIDLDIRQILYDKNMQVIAVIWKKHFHEPGEVLIQKYCDIEVQERLEEYCCKAAASSPTALASLVNRLQLRIQELSKMGIQESKIESCLPFLQHCDLRFIDHEKQARLLTKANPAILNELLFDSKKIQELPLDMPGLEQLDRQYYTHLRRLPSLRPDAEVIRWSAPDHQHSYDKDEIWI